MATTKKGVDVSTNIIWAALLVGMIRYSAAFLASDLGQIVGVVSEIITYALGFSGFAMGILSTLGTAYLFDGWRKKMPASGKSWPFKFVVLTIFVFLSFVCELAILVPFTVSRMEHESMSAVLSGGVWWWSTAVNVMPILLIGGVSVGNQIVTVSDGQLTGQLSDLSAGHKPELRDPNEKMTDWRQAKKKLSADQIAELLTMKTESICSKYGIEARTARRWRENAQKELESAKK